MTSADQRRVAFTRRLTQQDFNRFADLSGDDNPIHVDPSFAARTRFQKTVAHGMMLYAMICKAVGAFFPHQPVLALGQELIFENPTPADIAVTVTAWVIDEGPNGGITCVGAAVELPDGRAACRSRSLFCPADRPSQGPGPVMEAPVSASPAATYRHLALGQTARVKKKFGPGDQALYVAITGDDNPLWHDRHKARQAGFRDCLIPGPLLSALFSQLLGTRLPGRGTNWLKQKLQFLAPAYWNDDIEATVELVRLRPEKHLANLNGMCRDSQGTLVCTAQSLVLVKDIEDKVKGTVDGK